MKTAKKSNTTPVYLKSEFWMTMLTSVAGILLAFGVITPDQSGSLSKYAPNLIGALLSLLSTSKFVSTQHASKIEVFREMCDMRTRKGMSATAQSTPDSTVIDMARAAGL